jgi:hypothetical protein
MLTIFLPAPVTFEALGFVLVAQRAAVHALGSQKDLGTLIVGAVELATCVNLLLCCVVCVCVCMGVCGRGYV